MKTGRSSRLILRYGITVFFSPPKRERCLVAQRIPIRHGLFSKHGHGRPSASGSGHTVRKRPISHGFGRSRDLLGRRTVLPDAIKDDLIRHITDVRALCEKDRKDGINGVYLPGALEKKYPNAGEERGWFWLFPSRSLSVDPRSHVVRRHHIHPASLQKAFKSAVEETGIAKHASVHTLRHSFAAHLLENGYDIRTIQELLGHKFLHTTMICTHVAMKNVLGVRSPLDK